ncbi:MAG: hypothetical protein FGM14_09110 [Flavobacteriales bacterium]|nr:hypothetical protein [Flavobacteriales bacterium]
MNLNRINFFLVLIFIANFTFSQKKSMDLEKIKNRLFFRIYDKGSTNFLSENDIPVRNDILGVYSAIGLDHEKGFKLLSQQDIQSMGITEDSLFKISKSNLDNKYKNNLKFNNIKGSEGVEVNYLYDESDIFISSILLTDAIQEISKKHEFGILVGIPLRSMISYSPMNSKNDFEKTLNQIFTFTINAYNDDESPLSLVIFPNYMTKI